MAAKDVALYVPCVFSPDKGQRMEKLAGPVESVLWWMYRRIDTKREPMTRWNLSISEKTDRLVRSHLARIGMKKGDLSKFVDTAVRAEILRRTVKEVQDQNADLTAEEAMALANEAVAWARANPS
jgi:Cu/Ag efflux pump CusA